MKKILFAAGFLFLGAADAERMSIPQGTTRTYTSPNGRYTVKATAQTEGGDMWSMKLLDGAKEISSTSFHTPEALAVSDKGTMIAESNPTSHSEFGSESVSLYDAQWKLIRTIPFGDLSKIGEVTFRVVKVMTLSPDDGLLAIGEDGGEHVTLALHDTKTGELVWGKDIGLPEVHEIVFSPDSAHLLLATYDRENLDVLAQLFDRSGNLLSEKRVPKAFNSYDVNYVRFSRDGRSFEVLDTDKNVRVTEQVPAKDQKSF